MSPDLLDYSRSRAILIGTSRYQDKGFLPLPAAANSLKGLQEILVDPQLCRWPADRVTVLANPVDVRRIVPNLRRRARETDDVLLVYFVGHGTISPRGELCLAISDTEFDEPDVSGIEYERIRSALLDSPARIKVVILDCCYSGRAIQALSRPGSIADITDVRGVYTITASDYAAHVPALNHQAGACTSFTGELLDLIRTGIPGGPDTLTLNMIYSHLRTRLHRCKLPAPNQRGTDTVGEFGFTRNAALLPLPLERFPRPDKRPDARQVLRRRILAVAGVGALVAAAVFTTIELNGHGAIAGPVPPCSTATAVQSSTAKNSVVVGSADFAESTLLGDIYAGALRAAGFAVYRECYLANRAVSYPAVLSGQITVMPEYNGPLLTTTVDPNSKAASTQAVDAALTAKLPPALAILTASHAQDMDSVTVTRATAAKYDLVSIADLRLVAKNLVIGGPPEFRYRGQGLVGLRRKYGLVFKGFLPLDDSGSITIAGLMTGQVQVADIFTTTPVPAAYHFVRLTDPRHVFTVANIVPLVYKSRVNASERRTLNAVSADLTTAGLRKLDAQVASGQNPVTVAIAWLQRVGLGS